MRSYRHPFSHMKINIKLYILLVLAALISIPAAGISVERRAQLRDSLNRRLELLNRSSDSILPLYNLFDLTENDTTAMVFQLKRLYAAASNSENIEVKIDVLSKLARIYQKNDSVLNLITAELDDFVPSDHQKEVKLLIDCFQIDNSVNEGDSTMAAEFVRKYKTSEPGDPFIRARMLYSVCSTLAKTTQGELLEQYAGELERLISSMPLSTGTVRNLVYNRAAPVFTRNRRYATAVELDKKMLNVLDSLSTALTFSGRPYRKFEENRFSCFRRMMANYRALSPEEIESIHRSIGVLVRENPEIAARENDLQQIEIFYKLATAQWHRVIPMIKQQLNMPGQNDMRLYFLSALMEAAENDGDKQTMLDAAVELNKLMRSDMEMRAAERFRELQIVYDVNRLEKEKDLAKADALEARNKMLLWGGIAAAVLVSALAIAIIMLMRRSKRVRKLAQKNAVVAEKLRNERNELQQTQRDLIEARDQAKSADRQKTDFINNMSHEVKTPLAAIMEYSRLIVDCIPENQEKYLRRFANIIELNGKLVMTLLNDILDVASLEHDSMNIQRISTNIDDV